MSSPNEGGLLAPVWRFQETDGTPGEQPQGTKAEISNVMVAAAPQDGYGSGSQFFHTHTLLHLRFTACLCGSLALELVSFVCLCVVLRCVPSSLFPRGPGVYTYARNLSSPSGWSRVGPSLKPVGSAAFGASLSLSQNGTWLAVGSYTEFATRDSIYIFTSAAATPGN